jgi:hypothetical protein
MTKSVSGAALILRGIGKRDRLGRSEGLVPAPLFGNRLDRLERGRRRDVEDDDEFVDDEDDELDERRTTGPARELWALRDVNLVVQRGEAVGVVGPTGSGKSRFAELEDLAHKVNYLSRGMSDRLAEPEQEPAPVTIAAVRLLTREGDLLAEARAGETVTIEIDLGVHEASIILTGSVAFAQGDERSRFIALSPYVVDLCGRHLLQARVTLEGVIPGDYVGNAGVIANHSDGRVSEFLRSEAFRLSIERPEEDDGQRSDRPTVSWTVLNLPDDSVAATSAT